MKPLTGIIGVLADRETHVAREQARYQLREEIMGLVKEYEILAAELTPPSSEGSEGSGLKAKRKFAKGSQEAKDFMKSLRDKRKN
jgi:hypothetical protein